MSPADLPRPACRLGYTSTQILGVLGADRTARLNRWLDERPSAARPTCDGGRGSADAPTERACGPHGAVVPAAELENFLATERR